jgi:hypothetical protein
MNSILLILTLISGFIMGKFQSIQRQNPQTDYEYTLIQSSDTQLNLAGEWFDRRGRKWVVTQQNDTVILANEELKLRLQGILKGRTIKYTSYITLKTNKRQECQAYLDTKFEYETKLVVSKDGSKMEEQVPDSVSKGECKLSLKKMPALTLSRSYVK